MDSGKCKVSIVVPLLNEEGNIERLYAQIIQSLDGKYNYEIVFVDDGSSDGSFCILKHLQQEYDKVRLIRFRKNFGQTAALSAGFDMSCGDIVAAMDADLQNDPADIPMMIDKLDEGYDVVSGWRRDRQDKILTRLIPSAIANFFIAKITGVSARFVYRRLLAERSYKPLYHLDPAPMVQTFFTNPNSININILVKLLLIKSTRRRREKKHSIATNPNTLSSTLTPPHQSDLHRPRGFFWREFLRLLRLLLR